MQYFTKEFQERFMSGQADEREMLEAISELIRLKEHHAVRGYYRRLAQTMIDAGWIDDQGTIL